MGHVLHVTDMSPYELFGKS